MNLAEVIQDRMDVQAALGNGSAARAAVSAVLDLHRGLRIYGECGHHHEYGPGGSVSARLKDIENVGLTCETGYLYTICWSCCTEESGYQSEDCGTNHPHEGSEACWPCPTIAAVASALGVDLVSVGADT